MSNTLQIGLAVTGGLLLAGLMAHNAWQTRKSQPRRPDPEPANDSTARQEDVRQEPSLSGSGPGGTTTDAAAGNDVSLIAAQGLPALQAAERKLSLDPLLDAMAPLQLDAGAIVSGEAAQAALPATRRVDNKPFAVEGRNRDTGTWESPQAGQFYDQFQTGVQLANRSGSLNEIGFSEFTLKTQEFADAINATPHFPDMLEEVARARELDQFASAHDARLTFVLRARNAAWSTGYLQQAAARHGFVPGVLPGRLVLPATQEGAPAVLSLEFDTQAALAEDISQSAIYEALLGLEVTHVRQEEQPFQRMCSIAQQLAGEMDGTIADGNGYRIEQNAMEGIAADLEGLYQTLVQRDLAAGSDLARRLFS